MNEWQAMRQIEYLLRQRKWPGGATPVFAPGSVLSTVAPEEGAIRTMISPIVLLKPMEGQVDPDKKTQLDLEQQGVELMLVTVNPGDVIGHKALLGGNRPSPGATFGQTSSKGRGLLEVQTELKAAVRELNNVNGVRAQYSSQSHIGATIEPKSLYIAWRTYRFTLWCMDDLFYHPCRNFAATALGGGQVSMTWKIPPTRWDSFRVVLRRAAGAVAPASITAGTGIALAGNLSTSKTDTPGAGTFSYALFFTYDETNQFNPSGGVASQDQRVSEAATKTLVVT